MKQPVHDKKLSPDTEVSSRTKPLIAFSGEVIVSHAAAIVSPQVGSVVNILGCDNLVHLGTLADPCRCCAQQWCASILSNSACTRRAMNTDWQLGSIPVSGCTKVVAVLPLRRKFAHDAVAVWIAHARIGVATPVDRRNVHRSRYVTGDKPVDTGRFLGKLMSRQRRFISACMMVPPGRW